MIVVVRWCILFFFVSVCFIFIFCFAEKKSHRENLMKKACKVEFQPFNRSCLQLTFFIFFHKKLKNVSCEYNR